MKKRLVWAGILVLLVLGAIGYYRWSPRSVPGGQPPLVTLGAGELEPVREAFNAMPGRVRVLLMLSPT